MKRNRKKDNLPSGIYKRAKGYQAQWTQADGSRGSASAPTLELAKAVKAEKEALAFRVRQGLSNPRAEKLAAEAARPLADHLDDFAAVYAAKDVTPKHCRQMTRSAAEMVQMCGAQRVGDLTPGRVELALGRLREEGKHAATVNRYLLGVQTFCGWLVKDRRARHDDVADVRGIAKANIDRDRAYRRWAWTPDEHAGLLAATASLPMAYGLTGAERRRLYWFQAATGLRQGSTVKLTKRSFLLDRKPPVVDVTASQIKTGGDSMFVLPDGLADALRSHLACKRPDDLVFVVPNRPAEMLRADLAAAGIETATARGEKRDFYTLRHCFGTWHADGGTDMHDLQRMMGHASITTTARYYVHSSLQKRFDSMNRLRDFSTDDPAALVLQPPVKIGRQESEAVVPAGRKRRGKKPGSASESGLLQGKTRDAPSRTRTSNPLIKSQLLCQLS